MLLSLLSLILAPLSLLGDAHEAAEHFTDKWVVRISGGKDVADELAGELDYQNIGELKGFPDTYLMQKRNHPKRNRRDSLSLTKRLSDDRRVVWAEQQFAMKRVKRYVDLDEIDDTVNIPNSKEINRFDDELWPDQWYLHDTRTMNSLPLLDLRVTAVWDMGFTGKGIVVSVMDDGLEWNHTDIIKNYDETASFDLNDNDPDPFPRYDESESNNHGTRCAGEISMVADNRKCGVGVAYNSRIGGIRMLDGDVTDVIESAALSHNLHHIDIFSASWGPNDDGMTVDGPHRLAIEALEKGITEGRNGKGVIYVWASGNGGSKGDNCNCDGYTNSLYTLSVGSASQQGTFPWYGERCASTITAAYSSGTYTDQKISTTDLHDRCTLHHSGTSAAAPLAAGIVALILEANPNLTWRDMQHLVVWNSQYWPLKHNRGWKRNSAGLMYNSRFGFGLMDATAMVKSALQWKNVPSKSSCQVNASTRFPIPISSKGANEIEITLPTKGCEGDENEINYLEHVEVTIDVKYNFRGALDIFLFSPSGTESMILSRRSKDASTKGFRNWTFLSVHFWGEKPAGDWKVLIRDKTKSNNHGVIRNVSLKLHGTKEKPAHMHTAPHYYPSKSLEERTIDKIPEYDEQMPMDEDIFSDALDELKTEKGKSDLDWSDLVGKQLRHVDSNRNSIVHEYMDFLQRRNNYLSASNDDYLNEYK